MTNEQLKDHLSTVLSDFLQGLVDQLDDTPEQLTLCIGAVCATAEFLCIKSMGKTSAQLFLLQRVLSLAERASGISTTDQEG